MRLESWGGLGVLGKAKQGGGPFSAGIFGITLMLFQAGQWDPVTLPLVVSALIIILAVATLFSPCL